MDSPSPDRTATGRLFDITVFISQSVLPRVEWVVLKLDFSINEGNAWMRYLEMLSVRGVSVKVLKSCVWNSLTRIYHGQTLIGLLPSFSPAYVTTFNSKARSTNGLVVEISWHGRAVDGIGTRRRAAGRGARDKRWAGLQGQKVHYSRGRSKSWIHIAVVTI
jgi:hypothetical protein